MGEKTNIEWCDCTTNGTSGCDGCELWNDQKRTCYAGLLQTRRLSKSLPRLYSEDFKEVRMIPGRYAQAAAWSDLRGVKRPGKPWLDGMPRCIFVGDLGDTFSRAVTDDYLKDELLGAITSKAGQRHFWMLLTKRPRRLAELAHQWDGLPDNVMAMTTVTDQATANIRVPQLLKVPARWRGLSCEPLLEKVLLDNGSSSWLTCTSTMGENEIDSEEQCCEAFHSYGEHFHGIDWVICGGESGPGARPMHPDWARSLRDQCAEAGVPFFFKQWGQHAPTAAQPLRGIHTGGDLFLRPDGINTCQGDWWDGKAVAMDRRDKKANGRKLGVREYNGFPAIDGRSVKA